MIFEDPSRRRWRSALIVFIALSILALGTLVLMIAGIWISPPISSPFHSRPLVRAFDVERKIERDARPVYTQAQRRRMKRIRAEEERRRSRLVRNAKAKALPLPSGAVVAFTTQDDPASVAALEREIADIDVVIPDWFELPNAGCTLVERVDAPTRRVLSRSDALVLPRLVNLSSDQWRGAQTSRFLASDNARRCITKKLVNRLVSLGVDGINIDLEELQPEDSEPLLEFLVELRAALHAKSLRLTVDVSVYDPAYDIEFIGDVSDAVMVMAYDQHYPGSKPGPVAARLWFKELIDEVSVRVPQDRLVVLLGAYGYDWRLSQPYRKAESLSFKGAMDLARAAGAKPIFEPDYENAHFGYQDAEGVTHDVWFQDALTIWNQVRLLEERKISRVGLWRMGTEDETIWQFFGSESRRISPKELVSIPPSRSVELFGDGEVLSIRSVPVWGHRQLALGEHGKIKYAVYSNVPSGYLVERRGGTSSKEIVLTFDDGPDPKWTPRILDVLKELNVKAVFFVVGDQVMRFPELVGRMADEGHLIGNHTYSHPHMETLTPREAIVQLNTTQRLIEGITGVSTPLFRSPYMTNVDPERPEDLAPLRAAVQQGYVFVGAGIDSRDWKRPPAAEMVQHITEEILANKGSIVLMHDAGGDRSQTIAALRQLVPALRQKGYSFVPLERYLSVTRAELVRPVAAGEQLLSAGNALLARLRYWGWAVLAVLFFVCTLLSIGRILFLGVLVLREVKTRSVPDGDSTFAPLVTVIVPAYNEGRVVLSTLRTLLRSDYQNLDIVVVDDGSTDDTAELVSEFAKEEPRIRLIRQANAGKSAAANHGLQTAKGEIVVAVDADTLVPEPSIGKLVRHFANPTVTAVCGNVEVGNVQGLLTAFQAIEYVTSQNFDRRAFSTLNCISVVPGALGAWRRDAVLAVGGYSRDTLTEDADLTLTILRNGGRVVYESEAIARTEAPETLSGFLKQRFRWTYGSYQCLWKHRKALFRGTLGWVGLPNMFLFQILFPALSPIGDLVMILAIVRGDWQAFLAGYIAFLLMDLCGSILAFTLDRKPMKWLPLLIVQRFSYRQLMYYVSFRAMLAALRGARHAWRKLDRTGSVILQQGTSRGSLTDPIIVPPSQR